MLLSDHEISKSWHPSKNVLTLTNLTTQSGLKAWWVCDEGHEWECRIADRVKGKSKRGTGCPYCAGRKVLIGFNDLASLHPEIASDWHPTKNGDLKPSEFTTGSHMKAWWICSDGHEWKTSIKHRTGRLKTGCVYCSGNLVLTGFNDLATVNPLLAEQWHPTKNGNIFSTEVRPNSHKKFWWLGKCGHEWFAAISSRNRNHESGCPICSGKQVLIGLNDLASQYPVVANTWHPTKNMGLRPDGIHMATREKMWWQCKLGHEWQTTVASRARTVNGVTTYTGCPICSGRKVLTGFNDLTTQFPLVAKTWHPTKNGKINPNEVYAGGTKRYWWQCEKGHEWNIQMQSRLQNGGSNCPTCLANSFVSKGEQVIATFIIEAGFNAEQSNRSVFKSKRELDIYLPENNFAVEFNGLYYHSEEMGKDEQYHKNKWQACAEKSIELMQVWEDDWNDDPEKIKRIILKNLNQPVSLDMKGWSLGPCEQSEIIKFMQENIFSPDLDNVEACFKCCDSSGEMIAALTLHMEEGTCQIINYVDCLDFVSSRVLDLMLSRIELSMDINSYQVITDNSTLDYKVFRDLGFSISDEIQPSPSIMKRDKRIPVRVSSEGFSYLSETGEVHNAPKKKLIWDAGKTIWTK